MGLQRKNRYPTTAFMVKMRRPNGSSPSARVWAHAYVNNTIKMFDQLRSKLGFDVELLHDVHERVPPTQALVLAKAVEPFRLFFLEDALAPEDVSWFQIMRQQSTTPLAMGELFVNRHEWLPLVTNRWIDFIRRPGGKAWRLRVRRSFITWVSCLRCCSAPRNRPPIALIRSDSDLALVSVLVCMQRLKAVLAFL